jgi:hypothetical protein
VAKRYLAALEADGRVAALRYSERAYPWAVLHTGAFGTFATFHRDILGARRALTSLVSSAPTKVIVRTLMLTRRVSVGTVVDRDLHPEVL